MEQAEGSEDPYTFLHILLLILSYLVFASQQPKTNF